VTSSERRLQREYHPAAVEAGLAATAAVDGGTIEQAAGTENHRCLRVKARGGSREGKHRAQDPSAGLVRHLKYDSHAGRAPCDRGAVEAEGIVKLVSPLAEFKKTWDPYGIEVVFPYYVVELAETDVEQVVESGALDTEQALLLFRDMCKSVQRIHARRIVHRDLKPGNFLIMHDGSLRLSDFGTARTVGESTRPILDDYSGHFPGDIRYTPPEIISSLHDGDPGFAFLADVYSQGAILFELFTGVNLGTHIFDLKFQQDLLQHMAMVPRENRREVFDGFILQLADARPLPDITDFGTPMRRCVLPIVNDLYKGLAALDYRRRVCSFEHIFLKLNQALLVLRNEEKVKKWRQQREAYRANAILKQQKSKARMLASMKGIAQ